MEDWQDEIIKTMGAYEADERQAVQKISETIKNIANNKSKSPNNDPELQAALDELHLLEDKKQVIVQDAMSRLGVTEEDLQAIEAERQFRTPGHPDLILRSELTSENITPTKTIEDVLPSALDSLLHIVDTRWLRSQEGSHSRLSGSYLREELSIISGSRFTYKQSSQPFCPTSAHRTGFCQRASSLRLLAGAQSVPVIAALGSALDALKEVKGDVDGRLRSLCRTHSSFVDSTIYELLVAAACVECGRTVEFLQPDNVGKTPDIRLHDVHVPFVIECKRRSSLIGYEQEEELQARRMYRAAYAECQQIGISGVLEARIDCELSELSHRQFANDVRRLVLYGMHRRPVQFGWGSLAFRELPRRVSVPPTRLYSPNFLKAVFDWNTELPDFDGMLCRVDPPDDLVTDKAENALAMKWTSTSDTALIKKTRPIGALLGKAIKQVPIGEMGAIFMCFQEGAIPEVSDQRTHRIKEELYGWGHNWGIRVPEMRVNRLFPRPVNDSLPDLIENVFHFSAADSDLIFHDLLPSSILHSPLAARPSRSAWGTAMMIKFLARGTGSAAAAADYLTREQLPAHGQDQDQDQDQEKTRKKSKCCGAIRTRWPPWPTRWSSSTSTPRV